MVSALENLAPRDGEIYLEEGFLPPQEAAAFLHRLRTELAWREEHIRIAGRPIKVPRLVCWYGDAGAEYTYSKTRHVPLPWTSGLAELRQRIEAFAGRRFNSVLGNLYRDGSDSMGWHADQEKELGVNPCIASLSLGETRLFKLRHNRTGETLALYLGHGSLLVMAGALQHHWRHCVPKSRTAMGIRINLTFRAILA